MATLPPPQLYHFMGFGATGDMGPFTFYTSKNKHLVFFIKAPPTTPPTYHQQVQRERWRLAALQWSRQTPEVQAAWTATQDAANLNITGYNLWIYYRTTWDRNAIRTIENQTGLTLLPV